MHLREIMEKGQSISAKLEAEADRRRREEAERKREEAAARLRRAYELRNDPRPLGFRRPSSSHDLLPGKRAHIVERFEDLVKDPSNVEPNDLLVARWEHVKLDDYEHAQFHQRYGTTHKLVAVLVKDNTIVMYNLSDLVFNRNVIAWIKL